MLLYVKENIAIAHKLHRVSDLKSEKCKDLHGHNFKIEIWLERRTNDDMIVDVKEIKDIVKKYDHKYLNDFLDKPTMENFAKLLIKKLSEKIKDGNIRVRVWESENAYVEEENGWWI